jgi:hypothetical protein
MSSFERKATLYRRASNTGSSGHAQRSTRQVCRQLQRRVRFERRSSFGGCLGTLNVVLVLSDRMRWLFSYEYRKYLAEAPNAAYSEDAGAKLVFDSKLSRSKRFTCADIPPGVS